MINLLPPTQQEELRQEERFKLVLNLGIIILAFLVSLTLILFSIKISLSTDLKIQKIYFEQRNKKMEGLEIQELEAKINNYNSTLSKLIVFYHDQLDLTSMLEKISQALPEEIYLTTLNFNPQISQISLTGFSPNREILLQFKENLEKTEGLEKIYFPPANWIPATDIDFSVNFKISR
ncbi:MAG: PilN domain-containing protein [Patescibacteria group bacterium]|nr:PilN domain-containing protein [Patescibacteria group bacterium]